MFVSPTDLVATFQEWVAEVPSWAQPLITALAGAVPFVEGEGSVSIGIVGGMNPVVAWASAVVGNFLCVAVLVWLSAGARALVVDRARARSRAHDPAGVGSRALVPAGGMGASEPVEWRSEGESVGGSPVATRPVPVSARKAARQVKFQGALLKYGVPGVSLMGPLLLPTHFTATMLAAAGVSRARVLLWQGVAIVLWTTIFAVLMSLLMSAVSAS